VKQPHSSNVIASTLYIIEEDVSRVEVTEKRNYEKLKKLYCLSVNRAGCGLGTALKGRRAFYNTCDIV